jgi:hypothetical protein
MSILAFLLCFLLAAFFAVALFDFVHTSIGKPEINDDGEAQYMPTFIFSKFGAWVARKYNDAERRNANRLGKIADMYAFEESDRNYAKAVLSGENSLGRPSDEQIQQYLKNEYLQRLLVEDNFVNWFKPLGVCWYCTMFWFCTALGLVLLYAYSLYQPITLGAWLLSVLHFAPVCIKIRQIINS